MNDPRFFNVGPFADAAEAVHEFATNVFVSLMVAESLENREKLQQEYDQAVETQDEDHIRISRMRLEACDLSLHVAAKLLGQEENQPA